MQPFKVNVNYLCAVSPEVDPGTNNETFLGHFITFSPLAQFASGSPWPLEIAVGIPSTSPFKQQFLLPVVTKHGS